MERIKLETLEAVVTRINRITGNPAEPWRTEGGRNVANIGNYHLSGAYGGYALHQMHNENGGVEDVFRCGHVAKRDLLARMRAFIDGLEAK